MKLDGEVLNVGDDVYHITMGYGKVETIRDNQARVRMQRGGGVINVSNNGKISGVKVIFWREPIFIVPSKDQDAVLDDASKLLASAMDLAKNNILNNAGDK